MKYTMCRKKGVSTILGTLIFIGILFSAYAPMMLTMRQADAYYEQQKHQVNLLDDEKSREDLTFYVYPVGLDLNLSVTNSGPTSLKVVRVWINNQIQEESTTIQSMDSSLFGPYEVNPTEGDSYNIRVTTERGNIYEMDSGEITYGPGGWEVQTKIINVLISAPGTIFHIYVSIWDDGWVPVEDGQVQKLGGTAYKPFEVTMNGEYRVEITRGSSTIHDEDGIMMEWPDGPYSLWVYA